MTLLSFASRLVENLLVKKFGRQDMYTLRGFLVAPKTSGVYGLYKAQKAGEWPSIIYVGKTTSGISHGGLQRRLMEHYKKLLNAGEQCIYCRWLPLDSVWLAEALEVTLIAKHQPVLNGSGFGTRTRRSVDGDSNWERLLGGYNESLASKSTQF